MITGDGRDENNLRIPIRLWNDLGKDWVSMIYPI